MNRPDIKRLPKRANPLEAQKQLLDAVRSNVMPSEKVPLQDALGRVLAQDAVSNVNIPDYDKTFIDGYAINTADTKGASTAKPAAFKIIGKLFPADYPTAIEVANGEAVYVACGAPIPKGAAATVKVEETRLNGDKIEVIREIQSRRRYNSVWRRHEKRRFTSQKRAGSKTSGHWGTWLHWA